MTNPISVQQFGAIEVGDGDHGAHFGHHPRFRDRYLGVRWSYHRIGVPAAALVCRYPNLGEAEVPGGLGALIGLEGQLQGMRLVDIAARIHPTSGSEPRVIAHPLVRKIAGLTLMGVDGIYALPQPMMLEIGQSSVTVIEGNHRYLALLILGVDPVEGFDWSRVAIVS